MSLLTVLDLKDDPPALLVETAKLAKRLAAHVWLVHVASPEPDFVGYQVGPQSVRSSLSHTFHGEHQRLQEAAQRLRDDGLEATALLVQGPTAETILDEAERRGAALIVMGSHAHGLVHELLSGSVTRAVLRRATCPVVLVPSHEPV